MLRIVKVILLLLIGSSAFGQYQPWQSMPFNYRMKRVKADSGLIVPRLTTLNSLVSTVDSVGALFYYNTNNSLYVKTTTGAKSLAFNESVNSRFDSTTSKSRFIWNSLNFSAQTANIWTAGTVRFDLGSDAKHDMYYRDSATGRLTRLAPATYGYTLKAGPGGKPEYVDQSGDFIQNRSLASSAQTGNFNISGQGAVSGSNAYKIFLNRANRSTGNVLAFKTGTDTSGYVGLGSLLNNDVMLVGLTGSVSLRTRDTARIIFGSHSPEYSYVVGKKGKWKFGDSVQTAPTVPIEVESAQDTSILTSHKIIGNGLISNSTITASSAPPYSSGGISPIGRNSTSGRFEAYTPTLDQVTTSGNTTSNVVNVGSLGVSGAIHHSGAYYTPPKVVTATYSVLVSDHVILVNNNSAATITLPSATGLDGLTYEIKKISNNANNVTIATTSSQLVDDGSAPIITYNKSIKLMAYNGGWKIMAIAN